MYLIEQIEDEIIKALQASALKDLCPTIGSYHGELNDLVKEVSTLTLPLPAVLVVFEGAAFSEPANLSFDDEPTFTIVSIAKDLRGRMASNAGIYEILEIQKTTLIGNNLGLKLIMPLKPQKIEIHLITKTISVYSFDFKTQFSR